MQKKIAKALILLFLLALLPWPYGMFQLIRFGVTAGLVMLAVSSYAKDKIPWFYMFSALLFQPFLKISLGRGLWICVDLVMAIMFTIFILKGSFEEKNGKK